MVFLATMVYWSPKLTVFVFVFLPLSGVIVGLIGRSLRKISGDSQNKMGQLISTIEESLGGMRIIQAFNAEKLMEQKFYSLNGTYRITP